MDFTHLDLKGKSPQEVCDMIPINVRAPWNVHQRPLWQHEIIYNGQAWMPTGIPSFNWIPHEDVYFVIGKSDIVANLVIPKSRYVPHPCLLQSDSLKRILHQCHSKFDLDIGAAIVKDTEGKWREIGLLFDDNMVHKFETNQLSQAAIEKCLTDNGWDKSDINFQTVVHAAKK